MSIRFGILSTAKIAKVHVIPAMKKAAHVSVTAIAFRDAARARKVADDLDIPVSYGSYEELLQAPEVDAVYIPLPNHLHVEWAVKALQAGKHVLCEKPIAMNKADALKLKAEAEQHPGLKVMEAFMYRHHPRWQRAVEIVRSGRLGEIRSVHSFFSYYNTDPDNYRNKLEMGGGGLMDIGCYPISVARFIFGREPVSVSGYSDTDPEFLTDRLTTGMMNFETGTSVFTCSTQTYRDQFVKIHGTKGMMEIDWPFNTDPVKPSILKISTDEGEVVETFEPCNHYTLQAESFAKSILNDTPVEISLDDSIANMAVLDKIRDGQ